MASAIRAEIRGEEKEGPQPAPYSLTVDEWAEMYGFRRWPAESDKQLIGRVVDWVSRTGLNVRTK